MPSSKNPARLSCLLASNNSFVFTFSACCSLKLGTATRLKQIKFSPLMGSQKCLWGHVWILAQVSDSWPGLIQEQRTSPPGMIRGDGNWAGRGMKWQQRQKKSSAPGPLNLVGNNSKRFRGDCHGGTMSTFRWLGPQHLMCSNAQVQPYYLLAQTLWHVFPSCIAKHKFILTLKQQRLRMIVSLPSQDSKHRSRVKGNAFFSPDWKPTSTEQCKWQQTCLTSHGLPGLKVNEFKLINFLKRTRWS